MENICLFSLSASKSLASKVAQNLNIKLSEIDIIKFNDGEILINAKSSVRGKDVFIIQSTSPPVNEHLVELLIAIDSLKRASAKSINVVLPYFGYARQDRKARSREPISCKLVANLLVNAGATRVVTMDIHSRQSMGFFDIPMDDLTGINLFCDEIINIVEKNKQSNPKISIVTPDNGGMKRILKISNKLKGYHDLQLAVIDKRRVKPNQSEVGFVLGNIKDRVCFLIDDMIDTAGTICNAAKILKEKGAKQIYLIATHAVFSNPALERMNNSINDNIIDAVIVTDTIELNKNKQFKGLKIISIASLLSKMISSLSHNSSLSLVYDKIDAKTQTRLKNIKGTN